MGSSSGSPPWPSVVAGRVRQGVRALWPARQPIPLPERYAPQLPAEVQVAWAALAPFDQRHLVAVAGELMADGNNEHLVIAGLLHDIGKAGRISIGARVARVLIAPLGDSSQARWGARLGHLPGLTGLHLLMRHADTGADLLERSGMPPEIAWLVRHHERIIDHPELRALQAADRRN